MSYSSRIFGRRPGRDRRTVELGETQERTATSSAENRSSNAPEVRATTKPNGRDIHLLSIEGRGVCGLTALITLKEVLRQYQYHQKLPQLPRPCELFDIAGGTGTGGIVAIMLFRLEMSVDQAISAYTKLAKDVFSNKPVWSSMKTNSLRLEKAIAKVISSSLNIEEGQAQNISLLDDKGLKCFVTASAAKNLSSTTLFRTYESPRHPSHNCTIVEASRATTAEEPFFSSIEIGDVNVKEKFIHIGSRVNNPVRAVLEEAKLIFPGQRISCVLSIGSGAQGVIGFDAFSTTELAKVLHDGERISDEVAKDLFNRKSFYCRVNVDHGLEEIGFDHWEKLGDVRTHTQKYLEQYDVEIKISKLVQVLNRRTAIMSTVQETLRVLGQFLGGYIPELPLPWSTLISEFILTAKPSMAATETFNTHCALLQDTLESCMQGKEFMELPDELKENIRHLLEGLKKVFQDASGQEDPMMHVNANIQKLLQRFWFQNHISGNVMVHDILKHLQEDNSMKKTFSRIERHAINQNLGNLNVAPFAAYDSSEVSEKASCFKGTRVRLLNDIASWIVGDDSSVAPIYVLDGVAGIGKSTIAKTVAEHAAGINVLGANFFFSRNDDKRKTTKTFFPTIAYQLAHYNKEFADLIDVALLEDPHAVTQMPIKQFSTLIMEPLKDAFAAPGNPILIIIDALDECERDGEILLKIFADSIKKMPRLKLFVTTRPEYHIRRVLDRYHHLKRFHLQDIEKSVVQSDIRLYLDFHLAENQVRARFPDLHLTWNPAKKDIDALIETCGTLFIIASTAVKFVLDDKQSNPGKQLTWLLSGISRRDFSRSNHTIVMDSFYAQILLAAVPGNDHDEWFGRYQIVVGTIVALQYPLPCLAFSALIDLAPDDVKRALSHLYSLVAPTSQDLTFRIHHKSFPDFISSPSRCEQRFLIDLEMRHLELGKRCLSIMNCQLRPNICNLNSNDRFKDNSDVRHLTRDFVSQELAYALTHWATHLSSVSKLDGEAERLLEDFARKHFLAWLEVLSIIDQVEIAYPSLDRIGKLLDGLKTGPGIMREIVHDGCRFIARNIEFIKAAAGHVFSAFAFVPQDTRLYRTYQKTKGINLAVVSGHERKWNPTISIMRGHKRPVNFVTFSGDGTRLASASEDGMVRLWDGHTGAEIAVLQGHSLSVKAVVFSPDGTTLASASADTTLRLWDGQTGGEIAVLKGHSHEVESVAFSPDSTGLASASEDGTVRVWNGHTGAEIGILRGHSNTVKAVVFSPDGRRLASASHDCTVGLWDSRTGAEIAALEGHLEAVKSVVFSPDGMKLASASQDTAVRLWNGQTGAEIAVLRGHSDWVNAVVFSPDGTRLASASSDKTVRLWDAQTGAEITILQGHSVWINSVAFSPKDTRLASAFHDGTVRLWDSRTGAEVAVLRGHSYSVTSVIYSKDGTRLATSSNDCTARLWDCQANAETVGLLGHSNSVVSVVFSPSGTHFASASLDDGVRLWDGQTGAAIAVLQGRSESIESVTFSPDGTRLAAGFHDKTVRLWDGHTGAEIAFLRGHLRSAELLLFSPTGTRLASASNDGTVRVWDAQTGAEVAVLQGGRPYWFKPVRFSPDGTRLATASHDYAVRLWNGQTGAEISILRGHSNRIKLMAFSPDGTRLASACSSGDVRLWDGRTGTGISAIRGISSSTVDLLEFSPDGTRLVAAYYNGVVRLLDGQKGFKMATFARSSLIAFTLDSSALLSINPKELVLDNVITLRKLAKSFGASIDQIVEGARIPDSNLWIIRVHRKQPSIPGLLLVKVDDNGDPCFISLCWFPPDLRVNSFSVSSLRRVAVGCEDGRALLLEIDFSSVYSRSGQLIDPFDDKRYTRRL